MTYFVPFEIPVIATISEWCDGSHKEIFACAYLHLGAPMSPPPPSGEQTGLHEAGRDIRNGSVGGVSLWWKFRNRGADNKRGANYYDCGTDHNCGTDSHDSGRHHGCLHYN